MAVTLSLETAEFIRNSFKSVWALELLLLMRRERGREWSVTDLSRELRANDSIVSGILPEFIENGFVSETRKKLFRYKPKRRMLEQLVDRVAEAYAKNRVRVTEEILNAPNNQIQTFANAFKIKKD